jgi:exosortase/archaeosortase family protein
MGAKEFLKKLQAQKGWYDFIIRSLFFFGIIFAFYIFIFMWFRHTAFFATYLRIDESFYIPWLTGLRKTDFLNAFAFAVVAFIIWNRKTLKELSASTRSTTETIIFSGLSLLFIVGHYTLKYGIVHSGAEASLLLGFIKYIFLLGFFIMLAYACYTRHFLHTFFAHYKKSIGLFSLVAIAYFFLIQIFQLIWYKLSFFVASSVRFFLSLTFDVVYFSPGSHVSGPKLGIQGFLVSISDACSGIDSLLLFLSLYSLLFILDWRRMHIKRMLILFIPGIIGTILYNILRIYSLILVGVFYDPQFAVDAFHTNAGWILFLIFFFIFWHFGSKWVYKKTGKEPKKRR